MIPPDRSPVVQPAPLVAQPSASPVIGSKTFWAVVTALIAGLPEAIQKIFDLNILPPVWQEKLTVISGLAAVAAILLSRLAGKETGERSDAKTSAIASAVLNPNTTVSDAKLEAVKAVGQESEQR